MFSILSPRPRLWLFCSFWVVGLFCRVSAQTPQVVFQGKVLDPTLAPIAGARITASFESRSPSSSAVSDRNGEFSLLLAPGRYTLKIVAEGFVEHSRLMNLGTTTPAAQEIVLEITPHLDAVTVSDSGYQLAATSSGTKTLTPLCAMCPASRLIRARIIAIR
jgi:hypothetical protein